MARWSSTGASTKSWTQRWREELFPERSLRSVLFWRGIRVARISFLAAGLYYAGKSAGHVEVLEDPDRVAKEVVRDIIQSSHFSETGKKPAWHKRNSPLHKRVESIGSRVLHAAREDLRSKLAALPSFPPEPPEVTKRREQLTAALGRMPPPSADSDPPEILAKRQKLITALEELPNFPPEPEDVAEKRETLTKALGRLRGTWHYVVTNSDVPNAFVTPYCPRRIFVTEGLLKKLQLTDDELAFIMGHELSHVVHDHGACVRP